MERLCRQFTKRATQQKKQIYGMRYNDPLPHHTEDIDIRHVPIPVPQFLLDQMVNESPSVLWILSHKHTETKVGVATTTNGKVVGCREDINAVRESPLTTNVLLEGSLKGEREREMKELPPTNIVSMNSQQLLFCSSPHDQIT